MRTNGGEHQRLWRGIPSWQRSVLAMLAVLAALVQLGGSSAAPGDPPDVIGDWSAPFAWPIVAVHMSLTSTGEVFSLDGFDAALNSERVWNPQTGIFRSVPYGRNLFCGGQIQLADGRTLFVGGHIAAYEGLADTTLFNATDEHVLPRRRHGGAALVSDGDADAGRARCSSSPATGSCRTDPGCRTPSTMRPSTRCRSSTTRPRTLGRA